MRILTLSIEHVRGIHSLDLSPQGGNFVVWGPNGSGKSAVVDAIDFLLTGRISRLMGEGTGGITLKKYGPHIDTDPCNAWVRALVCMRAGSDAFEISRCMAHPRELVCADKHVQEIQPVLDIAPQGQHVLSRRELLRFITAESSSRAEDIQELLSLTEVESTRRVLVRAKNDAEKDRKLAEKNVAKARCAVCATTNHKEFAKEKVAQVVNLHRRTLGGADIEQLRSDLLKSGLSLPKSTAGKQSINVTLLGSDIAKLSEILAQENLVETDRELRTLLEALRSDVTKKRDVERAALFRLGASLIPDSGECPLCDAPWPPGQLLGRLESRMVAAEKALAQIDRVERLAEEVSERINTILPRAERIEAALVSGDLEDEIEPLQLWRKRLRELQECLESPLERYPDTRFPHKDVSRLLADASLSEELLELEKTLKERYPEATPEQTAWDALTRLEENLRALEDREAEAAVSRVVETRAVALHNCFVQARDKVLGALYDEISDRFSELYKELHDADESGFSAALRADGAGLALEVDFFGRGTHPPHALHSEGHQDSMGLCLYLALAERLTGDKLALTILDDVVMSVDAEHRRGICRLLAKHFPGRQFLITTHDKTWANQLRIEGIVDKRNICEFYKWDIDTGPYVNLESDLWSRIDEYLGDGDVNAAAALLRRGSEQFFAYVCDSLEAPVRYRVDGRNDLGDYLPAAIGKLRSLLKRAKKAAQSWGDSEQFALLNELDSTVGQIVARSQSEQWSINPAVHYTKWETFTSMDFVPVREAFQDLYALFVCQSDQCGSVIRLEKQEMTPTCVRCKCGKISWNLVAK